MLDTTAAVPSTLGDVDVEFGEQVAVVSLTPTVDLAFGAGVGEKWLYEPHWQLSEAQVLLGERQDGRGAAAEHLEHGGSATCVADFGARVAGADPSLAHGRRLLRVGHPPLVLAPRHPRPPRALRSRLPTRRRPSRNLQVTTRGHSSPHFRFGRDGG